MIKPKKRRIQKRENAISGRQWNPIVWEMPQKICLRFDDSARNSSVKLSGHAVEDFFNCGFRRHIEKCDSETMQAVKKAISKLVTFAFSVPVWAPAWGL